MKVSLNIHKKKGDNLLSLRKKLAIKAKKHQPGKPFRALCLKQNNDILKKIK